MSLEASNTEDKSSSLEDPGYLLPKGGVRPSVDSELIRMKAIKELGLEWSAPEEPVRSRLD